MKCLCELPRLSLMLFLLVCMKNPVDSRRSSMKSFELIRKFPHDSSCFTQGLEFYNGLLYESTGMVGESLVQIVHPDSGRILKRQFLDSNLFGEGLTVVDNKVYVVTWRDRKLLVFDADTLELLGINTYSTYSGQGWGIAFDGTHFIVSDGSNVLNIFEYPTQITMEAKELKKVGEIPVFSKRLPLQFINELEFIDGSLFANIWMQDLIVKINPSNGHILEAFDFRSLYPRSKRAKGTDCFNGIAYNDSTRSLVVTGKYWDMYYCVGIKGMSFNQDIHEDEL